MLESGESVPILLLANKVSAVPGACILVAGNCSLLQPPHIIHSITRCTWMFEFLVHCPIVREGEES